MFFNGNEVTAGTENKGDALVTLELMSEGARQTELSSKVMSKYGESIKTSIEQTLDSLQIEHARIVVNDFGALDFVIRARIETAVKRALAERKCQV